MQRGAWDYLDSPCDYQAFPHLPASYGGMSGGGIWSALLKSDATGQLKPHRFALVGVCYWQSGLENGVRILRGHFVRSIYHRAWQR